MFAFKEGIKHAARFTPAMRMSSSVATSSQEVRCSKPCPLPRFRYSGLLLFFSPFFSSLLFLIFSTSFSAHNRIEWVHVFALCSLLLASSSAFDGTLAWPTIHLLSMFILIQVVVLSRKKERGRSCLCIIVACACIRKIDLPVPHGSTCFLWYVDPASGKQVHAHPSTERLFYFLFIKLRPKNTAKNLTKLVPLLNHYVINVFLRRLLWHQMVIVGEAAVSSENRFFTKHSPFIKTGATARRFLFFLVFFSFFFSEGRPD